MNNCVIPQKIANDIFVRHENGGKTTIHSNKLGLKFLNETATMVFDLCTGYNTIEYICDEMQSRFPDVSSDIIRSDVEEIIYYFINPIPDYETVLQRSHLLDCKNRIMVEFFLLGRKVRTVEIDEGIAVGEYFDEASVTSDQVSNFIKDNNLFSFYHFFCTDDIWSQGMKAFSRGEIQKIRLLRSLTKETANFLILDEPSSFMDFESSNELMSVLQSVRNDRIILLISHDPIYSESDFIKISI